MMQAITDMNIQYEDKELLVVYKPAGLATQSAIRSRITQRSAQRPLD